MQYFSIINNGYKLVIAMVVEVYGNRWGYFKFYDPFYMLQVGIAHLSTQEHQNPLDIKLFYTIFYRHFTIQTH